jgi:hypothetical protein
LSVAQILAQNGADGARMMPFYAPVWPAKRTKQTNPTIDMNITNRLLYQLSYLGPLHLPRADDLTMIILDCEKPTSKHRIECS